ncbi:hypothetical protein ASPCADRAFT_397054 [Aspergillus carbonarius ITEM 5010]|uniref:C2H2-type domain-containing protein n=1 Tax=Aspergillus carbonarius (strain ITEM 5010) TaxID=602072 RepID=A0A1R3RLG2_ASPC5|nr:hypothetical protein ASPCADRAFT_397054 [Aspergillus carbonarius ITEM 5010]
MLEIHNRPVPPKRRRRGPCKSGNARRPCPHCGRTFKRTEHLERHVRTHTKEKPFLCHCGSSFSRPDLLKRHRKLTHHEEASSLKNAVLETTFGVPVVAGNSIPREHGSTADEASLPAVPGLDVDSQFCSRTQPWSQPLVPAVGEQSQQQGLMDAAQYAPNVLPPILDNGFDAYAQFKDFTSFLDSLGLSADWSPFFLDPGRRGDVVETTPREESHQTGSLQEGSRTRAGTPFSSWLPSVPVGNRALSYVSDTDNPRAVDPEVRPFKVSEEQRSKLNSTLLTLGNLLDPNFCLPSRHAITRYITSFFEGFHSHMPFIHVPTWDIQEHSIEFILGIAAAGAQYCFERKVSERLFFAGKAILMERLGRKSEIIGPLTRSVISGANLVRQKSNQGDTDRIPSVDTIGALITLMGFATWEPKPLMVRESFALQSLLTEVVRDAGLEDIDDPLPPAPSSQAGEDTRLEQHWRAWIARESSRRSRLIAFSFLHTHSIAYNVYPTLRSNEVGLRLPCSTKEWKAPTAMQWYAARNEVQKPQLYFREALFSLLKNRNESVPLDPIPTPLGNYVLLHGLLQRIHIVRDLSLPLMSNTAALPSEEAEKLERGLRSWTSCWQQAPESSLNPNNENGPIPFTSSSLLALAYVRLHLHLGPYRHLETRDPARIAQAIASSPGIERSDSVIAALLYATHMLSIPIRLGVERVARSQAFFWSVRHSLSSLECGVLLSKWLARIAVTINDKPLSDSERSILHWVRRIVEEAYTVIDFDEETQSLDTRDPTTLSLAVLRIWARFFKSNTQWAFINIIGRSLELYLEIVVRGRRRIME